MGTLNAATGVGWGIIMIPVLFLIPALTPQQAVAVSLLAYLFNSLVASFENVRSDLIVRRYAVYLSAGDAQHHANHPVRRQSLFPERRPAPGVGGRGVPGRERDQALDTGRGGRGQPLLRGEAAPGGLAAPCDLRPGAGLVGGQRARRRK